MEVKMPSAAASSFDFMLVVKVLSLLLILIKLSRILIKRPTRLETTVSKLALPYYNIFGQMKDEDINLLVETIRNTLANQKERPSY